MLLKKASPTNANIITNTLHLTPSLGILDRDPFVVVDQNGVGKLIELSVSGAKEAFVDSASKGRAFKAGVCGEHGGDPTSVKYFNSIGLNYVSCRCVRNSGSGEISYLNPYNLSAFF